MPEINRVPRPVPVSLPSSELPATPASVDAPAVAPGDSFRADGDDKAAILAAETRAAAAAAPLAQKAEGARAKLNEAAPPPATKTRPTASTAELQAQKAAALAQKPALNETIKKSEATIAQTD